MIWLVIANTIIIFYLIWWVVDFQTKRKPNSKVKKIAVRNIPDSYFTGYRRLANTRSEITEEKCWTCRHAIAYRTWHCDLKTKCSYQTCYIKDEISEDDYKAGIDPRNPLFDKWLGLPPPKGIDLNKK